MLRRKFAALALAATAVLAAAGPAAALSTLSDPNNAGVPGCSGKTTIRTYSIDNPRKSGWQKWGTARVMRGTCYTSTTGSGWTGVWTEARLDFAGDSLKTSISVESDAGYLYTVSDWDARGANVWHDSPALQYPSGNYYLPSVATSADGDLRLAVI